VTAVWLVRHGQASWGAADYDVLSDLGQRQSRVVGAALAARRVTPDVVVSGAMRRHRQTAAAALEGAGWGCDVVEDDGWNEFNHRQMLALHPSGQPDGEEMTRAAFQAWFEQATLRWTSGQFAEEYDEPFTGFCARVEAALRRTLDRLAGASTAVVFTSGGPVAWVAASLLGGDAALWAQLNPVTVNASVTKVVVGSRGCTLVSFNDHGHLETETGLLSYR
jgi:broad specificity phosphatase PhoE